MKHISDGFLDEFNLLLISEEYFFEKLDKPWTSSIGIIIIGQEICGEDFFSRKEEK